MIVVTVTLVPGGYGPPEELGRMIIANDGTQGAGPVGDYVVRLGRKGQADNAQIYRKPQRQGEVKGHRRLALSVWNLVGKALHAVGHGAEVKVEKKCDDPYHADDCQRGCSDPRVGGMCEP